MAVICLFRHVILLLLVVCVVSQSTSDDLVINTKQGRVQGRLLSGSSVRAFLGIPFGKPPVGKLRFRAPVPVDGWQGIKDATNLPNSCFQIPDTKFPGLKDAEMWNPNTPLSEDCLYLNVWSPRFNKTSSTLVPVLVWIHGGGFFTGTSTLDVYDGRFLSTSELVVVVSMNYRIGPLGFLSLPNNENIQGNAGLLDQQLALKWVADNIAAFGGDASKVTIFGESAGGASVGFHLLSPGSYSLFQRAVMQSGSPNAAWATISQTEAWQRATKLAELLGCPTSDPQLEECLLQLDAGKITLMQSDVITEPHLLAFPFVPVVDGNFLPDEVEVLLRIGSFPKKELLLGLNEDEGTYFVLYEVPGYSLNDQSPITRKEFLNGVSLTMRDASEVSRETATFQYTDWTDENNGIKNRDLLSNLVGDRFFFCPMLEFARRYSQNGGRTFLYFFDHVSSITSWPAWIGATHGNEVPFVFGIPLDSSLRYSKNEVNMTKKFMKHWANFARTGDPSINGVKWPVFTPGQQEYVTLNYNHPEQKRMMKANECHLWNKLLPKIQTVSDNLETCAKGNGVTLFSNYFFLLFALAINLAF
ncbi:uncharacterized protein V6R79_015333 [Siganus canaliculatus]